MKKLLIVIPLLFLFACAIGGQSETDYNQLMLDSKKINEYSYSIDFDKATFPRDIYQQEILLKPHVINALRNMRNRGFKYVQLINQHPTEEELKVIFTKDNTTLKPKQEIIRFRFEVVGLKKQYNGYVLNDLITALQNDIADAQHLRNKYLNSSAIHNTILVNNK